MLQGWATMENKLAPQGRRNQTWRAIPYWALISSYLAATYGCEINKKPEALVAVSEMSTKSFFALISYCRLLLGSPAKVHQGWQEVRQTVYARAAGLLGRVWWGDGNRARRRRDEVLAGQLQKLWRGKINEFNDSGVTWVFIGTGKPDILLIETAAFEIACCLFSLPQISHFPARGLELRIWNKEELFSMAGFRF